jgi:3'(2'), 5'-bisphosphate nucleotidase
LILTKLQRLTPDLPVLSEESKEIPYEKRKYWDNFWLVDPLDGTKEFIKRNGEFTVNIALITRGVPTIGVVHAPALSVTYYAAQNEGAFIQRTGEKPQKITVNSSEESTLKIVASRSHASESLEKFLEQLRNYECLSMGSSLKFCLVADGTAHLYPRLGPTMEWDTASGHCIVEAAGGSVSTLAEGPLLYNKPQLTNPDFLVCAGSAIRWKPYFDASAINPY